MFYEQLAYWLRLVHILFGFAGLLVMLMPLAVQKGSRQHVRFGTMFEWCCYIVGVTGFVSSIWWLLFPSTRPELAERTAEELSGVTADIQFLFGLILFIGIVLLSTTRFGVRVIRCSRQRTKLDNWETKSWAILIVLISFGLALVAVTRLPTQGFVNKHSIFLTFPLIAILDVRSKLKFARELTATPKLRLRQHVDCMSGSVIAFSTAFLVLGGNRIYGHLLDETVLVVTFLFPTLVGVSLNKLYATKLIDKFLLNTND